MRGLNALTVAGLIVSAVTWLLVVLALSKYPDAAPAGYSWDSWMFWGGSWTQPANLIILKQLLPIAVGVQILGILLMAAWPGSLFGLLIALAGCLAMWPIGMIVIEGCLRAHNRDKYRCLEQFQQQKDPDETPVPGPFSALYSSPIPGFLLMALGAGFIYLSGIDCATLMFLFFGITLVVRAVRLRKQCVGLIYKDFMSVRLNVWSPVYNIPNDIITDYKIDHRNMYLDLNVDKGTIKIKVPIRCIASFFEKGFRHYCKVKLAELLPGKAPKVDDDRDD